MHTCITAQWLSGYALAVFRYDTLSIILSAASAGGIIYQSIRYFLKRHRCCMEVEAAISRILERRNSDSDPIYAPEYTYYFDGQQYVVCSKRYTNFDGYTVGDRVKLYIDPARPGTCQDRKRDLKILIFYIVFCGVFGTVGFLLHLKLQKG